MMHPNIDPELGRILMDTESLDTTLIPIGYDLTVYFTGERRFVFRRIEGETLAVPVGDVPLFELVNARVDDSFLNRIQKETTLSLPLEGKHVGIAGGCTWAPSSEFGFTMLHVRHIDAGRCLLWRMCEPGSTLVGSGRETNVLSPKTVISWNLRPA